MEDSKEGQETPKNPWLLISDNEFGLQDWLKSVNPNVSTINIRISDQISIIEVRTKESKVGQKPHYQVDILLGPNGHILGIKQTENDIDKEEIVATILGEKIITYQFDRSEVESNSRFPFSEGQPFFTICYKDKMHLPRSYNKMELIGLSQTATGPDDVQVEYDFNYREGAYTPHTSFVRGLYKIYNGGKSHKADAFGHSKPLPPEAISETTNKVVASWPSADKKFQIKVEVPKAFNMGDVLRIEQVLNTETDWLNLPREIPVIHYSMSSNQLPEK
jgi:hypothetical protein